MCIGYAKYTSCLASTSGYSQPSHLHLNHIHAAASTEFVMRTCSLVDAYGMGTKDIWEAREHSSGTYQMDIIIFSIYIYIYYYYYIYMGLCPAKSPFWSLNFITIKIVRYKKATYLYNSFIFSFQISYTCSHISSLCANIFWCSRYFPCHGYKDL